MYRPGLSPSLAHQVWSATRDNDKQRQRPDGLFPQEWAYAEQLRGVQTATTALLKISAKYKKDKANRKLTLGQMIAEGVPRLLLSTLTVYLHATNATNALKPDLSILRKLQTDYNQTPERFRSQNIAPLPTDSEFIFLHLFIEMTITIFNSYLLLFFRGFLFVVMLI